MKIVREHINEIKRGVEGLGALGIGHKEVIKDLVDFLKRNANYSHLAFHDAHGRRIANILGAQLEEVIQYGISGPDITETILYFGQSDQSFSKYKREYWVWNNPKFIVEYVPKTDEILLYTNSLKW